MAVFNIGSINIDNVYRVAEFAATGETVLVTGFSRGLGGKGANQSIALARAGSQIHHVGAVGADNDGVVDAIRKAGVDTTRVLTVDEPTGHAVIQVNEKAENSILVCSGANLSLTRGQIDQAVSGMQESDWLLFQNETNLVQYIARAGHARKVRIAYSAAPFIAEHVEAILPLVRLLVVNELEAAALASLLDVDIDDIPVPVLVITRGRNGARYISKAGEPGESIDITVPAFSVDAVDTTGAGDTFLGYLLSSLDTGFDAETALRRASAAAALQVSRPGAADAIPYSVDVDAFLAQHVTAP